MTKRYSKPRDFLKMVGYENGIPTFIYSVHVTDQDGKDEQLSHKVTAEGYKGSIGNSYEIVEPEDGEEDRIIHEVFFPQMRPAEPTHDENA